MKSGSFEGDMCRRPVVTHLPMTVAGCAHWRTSAAFAASVDEGGDRRRNVLPNYPFATATPIFYKGDEISRRYRIVSRSDVGQTDRRQTNATTKIEGSYMY